MSGELKDKIEPTASRVMRTPRRLEIEITARCNLRCHYCYFFNNPAVEYRDLPSDEWFKFFDELGRINHDSLAEVWQNSPALNQLRNRHKIPLAGFEFCAGCSYIPYCTGNCPGLAYTMTRQVDHPILDACLRRFLDEGGTLP